MNTFLRYNEFISRQDLDSIQEMLSKDPKKSLIESILQSNLLSLEETFVLDRIYEDNQYENLFEDNLSQDWIDNSLTEKSFKDWIEDKGESAANKLKTVKTKSLKTIAKLTKSFSAFVSFIVKSVKSFLEKTWKWIQSTVNKAYAPAKGPVTEAAKEAKIVGHELKDESTNLKGMTKTGVKWVTGGVMSEMKKGFSKIGKNKVEECTLPELIQLGVYEAIYEIIRNEGKEFLNEIAGFDEDLINEDDDKAYVPGLHKVRSYLTKISPFKWLHNLGDIIAKGANNFLEKLSSVLTVKAGAAGPHKFKWTGKLVGFAAEWVVKEAFMKNASALAMKVGMVGLSGAAAVAIPGLGSLITIMYWVGEAIWFIEIADEVAAYLNKEIKDKIKSNRAKKALKAT